MISFYTTITNPKTINANQISNNIKDNHLVTIQFDGDSYDGDLLNKLNQLCEKQNKNLRIRFYSLKKGSFDGDTLTKLLHVKNLHIDHLNNVSNISTIMDLEYLEELRLGIWELKDLNILVAHPFKKLVTLIISETKTKSLDLECLKGYTGLTSLTIEGHCKNIASLSLLPNLQELKLTSINKNIPLDFVNRISKLNTLGISLGSRHNIDEIDENNIDTLEIVRVRGFSGFRQLHRFKNVRKLVLRDQIQLKELDFRKSLRRLETLEVSNCKTFKTITNLANLPLLRTLVLSRTAIDFDQFIKQKLPPKLDVISFYTESSQDKRIQQKLQDLGYARGSD